MVEMLWASKNATVPMRFPVPEWIFEYERLRIPGYPACELIGQRAEYSNPDRTLMLPEFRIVIRWSVLEDDEERSTRAVEILCRATAKRFFDDGHTTGLPTSGYPARSCSSKRTIAALRRSRRTRSFGSAASSLTSRRGTARRVGFRV
jgi:hypothetical protein